MKFPQFRKFEPGPAGVSMLSQAIKLDALRRLLRFARILAERSDLLIKLISGESVIISAQAEGSEIGNLVLQKKKNL